MTLRANLLSPATGLPSASRWHPLLVISLSRHKMEDISRRKLSAAKRQRSPPSVRKDAYEVSRMTLGTTLKRSTVPVAKLGVGRGKFEGGAGFLRGFGPRVLFFRMFARKKQKLNPVQMSSDEEAYQACLVLSGAGDAIGYKARSCFIVLSVLRRATDGHKMAAICFNITRFPERLLRIRSDTLF